jgi:dTDP-4-amino-4,6-dideoxygalactose transaminase
LDSGYMTEGPVTREFEAAIAGYVGCPHAIAVTSCTTGLEIALRAAGIGPGDEVIVPDYTHPATAAVVAIVGATIVLVDVDPETMLIDYDAAEAAITSRTRALLPVSQFGNPLDYDRLDALRGANNLVVIEDAACALGAEYKGNKVGSQADVAVFSCHPRKFITTGEGGIVVTNNDELAKCMQSYKNFGIGRADSRAGARFERFGTNYKMSDILAAVGISQMEHIDEMLARRQELARNYARFLRDHEQIRLPVTTAGGTHSYQTFCVLIDNRDHVLTELRSQGIEVQIGTYALHRHRAYVNGSQCRHAGGLAGSDTAFERCLALPLSHTLTAAEQEEVLSGLDKLAKTTEVNARNDSGSDTPWPKV